MHEQPEARTSNILMTSVCLMPIFVTICWLRLRSFHGGGDSGLSAFGEYLMECAAAYMIVFGVGIPAWIWSNRLSKKQGIDSGLAKLLRAGVLVVMAGFVALFCWFVFLLFREASRA